jgi:hypothetical protein
VVRLAVAMVSDQAVAPPVAELVGMKGILMLNQHGVAVSAWVNLDSPCSVEPELFADELQIGFGSDSSSLRLIITEEMVDQLAVVFADAKARFQEMDDETEREQDEP